MKLILDPMVPRFVEREHVGNGGFELWSGGLPVGWSLVTDGTATGAFVQEQSFVFAGASALKIQRTGGSGRVYARGVPLESLIPGRWYRVSLAYSRLLSTGGGPNTAGSGVVNLTRNTSLNTSAVFAAGVLQNWAPAPGLGRYFYKVLWFQVPPSYSDSDSWLLEAGIKSSTTGNPDTVVDAFSLLGPYERPLHKLGLAGAAYHWDTPRLEHRVTLFDPLGREYDVTDRLNLGGVGTITEGAEESLLSITHGDLHLTFQDTDGFLASLLVGAEPSDRWELVVERETGRRRMKWDRLFAGVLDLPWSVSMDRAEKTITVQVFSYTKTLERVSGETHARTFEGRTGTVTAGTAAVTMNSTAGLEEGDQVELDNGNGTTETQTVLRVTSATAWTAAANFTNGFSGATARLVTPYYRQRPPEDLARELFALGGIVTPNIQMAAGLAAYPVPTPLCSLGLGNFDPVNLYTQGGLLKCLTSQGRQATTDPRSKWASEGASTAVVGDWSPYLLAEPGTLSSRTGGFGSVQDAGAQCWNHAASAWYECTELVSGAPPTQSHTLQLKDQGGVVRATVDSWVGNAAVPWVAYVEYDPVGGRVWVSHTRSSGAPSAKSELLVYDTATWTKTVVVSTFEGRLRFSRKLGRMFTASLTTRPNTTVKEWSLDAAPSLVTTRTLPADCVLWTLRAWDDSVAILARPNNTQVVVHLFDADTWALRSSTNVPSLRFTQNVFSHVFPDAQFGSVLVVMAFGRWLVFSKGYAGVVPYANWAGLSVAGALKELALATMSYLSVDRYNVGSLVQRLSVEAGTPLLDLGVPLSRKDRTIWENYYRSVAIRYTDSGGVTRERIAGESGASGSRFSVESKLVDTESLADSVAAFFLVYVGQNRVEAEVAVFEQEELVRPMDLVTMDGTTWLVAEARTNPQDREQRLRLFEVKG